MSYDSGDWYVPSVLDDGTGVSTQGGANDDDAEEDEDDDDDSSSNNNKSPNLVKLLNDFRSQWHQEIENRVTKDGINNNTNATQRSHSFVSSTRSNQNENIQPTTTDDNAKNLFQRGILAEQGGQLIEAVGYYRSAIQLVPDVESKIDYRSLITAQRYRNESESSVDSGTGDEEDEVKPRKVPCSENAICQPVYQPSGTHISALPLELMMMILRWVISDDLDLYSLEMVSMVCRGFYMCARDEELWKKVCTRVWGINRGSRRKYNGSWRIMYIERPHLRFNGVYISKLSYMRQGEKRIDNFYNPWQFVEYFRYVRFFPDGVMLMLTSPEDPLSMVTKLRRRDSTRQGLLKGFYKLTGHTVTAILKRVPFRLSKQVPFRLLNNNQNMQPSFEQSFHVGFTVISCGKRKCYRLVWNHYSVHTIRRPSGEETISEFELSNKNYPNLYFYRVKSYTALSGGPLK